MREYEQFGRMVEQASAQARAEEDLEYQWNRDAAQSHDDLYGLEEHNEFHYSSESEWDNAEAMQLGEENPERAWVLTDRDVWHANPYYKGPRMPHPELEIWEDEDVEAWRRGEEAREAGVAAHHVWVDENHDEVGDIPF